jgi:tRNA A37 threonylcarbamoyltransferase TsaD
LSTDNAAMIAAAAFPKFERGEFTDLSAPATAGLALA